MLWIADNSKMLYKTYLKSNRLTSLCQLDDIFIIRFSLLNYRVARMDSFWSSLLLNSTTTVVFHPVVSSAVIASHINCATNNRSADLRKPQEDDRLHGDAHDSRNAGISSFHFPSDTSCDRHDHNPVDRPWNGHHPRGPAITLAYERPASDIMLLMPRDRKKETSITPKYEQLLLSRFLSKSYGIYL